MNIISLLAVPAPKDLWTIIINWIQGAIGNYGWTILLFTLLVKLAMSPLDFMVKLSTKKQNLIQKKCSPQIAKLQKRFASSPEQLKIQTQAIYKREGMKMGTSCVIMLVNMILTMVVFFSLFSSLKKVSAYEVINQYETIEQTYTNEFVSYLKTATGDSSISDGGSANEWVASLDENDPDYLENRKIVSDATDFASNAVLKQWNECKDSWLWVQNVWVADATTAPLPTYDGLVSIANNGKYKSYVENNIDKDTYSKISAIISNESENSKNGYYIIPILAGLLTFLSQIVMDLHNKLKNKKAQKLANASDTSGSSMKILKIIMPIIMVGFALSSSASFGIYLIASSIASILIGEVVSLIINKLTKKQQEQIEASLEKEANRLIKKGKLQEN